MQHKWLNSILLILVVSVTCVISSDDLYVADFKQQVESLLLNTTDEALLTTINVYQNLTTIMSPKIRELTKVFIDKYVKLVKHSLECEANNYTQKRKLLRHFDESNWLIDRLRRKLEPETPKYNFQIISEDFYFNGRNITIFDNLYMNFIQKFQKASEALRANLSEDVVQNEKELLELLDEISKARTLEEKDEFYDDFIKKFLFKIDKDRLETKELE